ncbi:hypothetical protein GCM10009742_58860 [Kribbella karoonensis]|uniref:Uncharacterized protein n=1 Tax=Kribbella karoonensis TaxID=324851 RepID=A0ABP4QAF5_9ACTN
MVNELLDAIDRASANLTKLEGVWARAQPSLPTGPALGTTPEYEDLQRTWMDLLGGLPPVDGWTITAPLPDMNELGQTYLDYADIGELPTSAWEAAEQPGRDLQDRTATRTATGSVTRFRVEPGLRRSARTSAGAAEHLRLMGDGSASVDP